jgi:murein hydrolase activator
MTLTSRILLALLLCAPLAHAQRAEQQEAEQWLRELQAQINRFEEQLTVARTDESTAMEALDIIDREIAVREALVESYANRLSDLGKETIAIENEMGRSQRELGRLREEYARYARQAYIRGRVGDLALILSAGSINEMLVRARYLQRFSSQRQRAAQDIIRTQEELAQRRVQLDSTAFRVESLLADSRVEQAQLSTRQRERAQMVTQLRQRRTTLQAEVRRRQQEAGRLQSRIQELIAEGEAERRAAAAAEARRADEAAATAAAAAEAGRPAPPPRAPVAAPEVSEAEFARLSGSFRQNRGQLPWPVSGVVTEAFGPRRNEVTGTITDTPGIVISSSPMTPVRSVFGGAVSRIAVMPEWGTFVIVSHGDFATVYGNLSSVDVRTGQRVEAGAVVGRAGTPDQPLGPAIFFAVFERGAPTNPSAWLNRR